MNKYSHLNKENYRVANVQLIVDSRGYNKSKIYVPLVWFIDMGINKDDKLIELSYDKEKGEITIRKFTGEK